MRLIRSGIVTSLNEKEASARVKFHDTKTISKELKVLESHSNKTKTYSMPSIGEEVLCVFLPHAPSVGYIIGSYYTKKNLPLESGKIETIVYEDGTKIKYDMEKSILEVNCVGDVIANCVNFTGTVTEMVTLQCKNASITATENINAKCKILNASADDSLTLKAPAIVLDGEVTTTQNVVAAKNITAGIDVTAGVNVNCVDTITSKGSVNSHPHTGNLGTPTAAMYE